MGSDEDLSRQRVAAWWQTLDPTAKRMFEEIRAEQPELALRVIGGGRLAPADEGTTLDALFAGGSGNTVIDPEFAPDLPVIDPSYPEVRVPFTVTYQVANQGVDARSARRDQVRLVDVGGNAVAARDVGGTALAANAAETMQATFDQGAAEGTYTVQVWVNADGAEWGAPANDQGKQNVTAAALTVGAYQSAAGPATARDTLFTEATRLGVEAAMMVGAASWANDFLPCAAAFARRAAAVLGAAASSYPNWQGGLEIAGQASGAADSLERLDPTYVEVWDGGTFLELATAAQQASAPFVNLAVDEDMLVRYGGVLASAAVDLARYSAQAAR